MFINKNFLYFSLDPAVFARNSLQKITIAYDDFSYVLCLSNRKIYVAKKKNVKWINNLLLLVGEVNVFDNLR